MGNQKLLGNFTKQIITVLLGLPDELRHTDQMVQVLFNTL